jgi:hypothetical protein
MAFGTTRNEAIADALAFRAERHRLFPNAAAGESALELNEGVAEYTGVRLSSITVADFAKSLDSAARLPSYVRSFAYYTGPAYGLLLDVLRPDWRVGLKPGMDLTALLPIAPAKNAAAQAQLYAVDALRSMEIERERKRSEQQAEYMRRFVEGAVLTVRNHGQWKFTFDPNNVIPLGDRGTVYPQLRLSDRWGVLEAKNGALMSSDFTRVAIPAPSNTSGGTLSGDGWTLQLNNGWELKPATQPGSYTLEPTP